MNERIKELAEQAESYADSLKIVRASEYAAIKEQKFAELIVAECANIADQESKAQKTNHGRQAADRIWHTITNKFGVN